MDNYGIYFPVPRFPKKFGSSSKSGGDEKEVIEFPAILTTCLKELRLADNNLDSVPPSVCNMRMLEVLDLS